MYIRNIVLLIILGISATVNAQTGKYCSPFDFPLLLSSNFGELRPNHFHCGLDIKSKGTEGHPVHCIGNGYVSRILITHGGYGQAVYINHPDGLTSVYGHVKSFSKKIEKRVRDYQYKHETYNCDLAFKPGEIEVKRGEVIALSGNEGASGGPHLHLEVRRTATNEYLDPLPYYKHLIKDSKAPEASAFVLYPVEGKGVVNGSTKKFVFSPASAGKLNTAWGQIYFGLKALDHMDNTSNRYGVHRVTLFVDGKKFMSSVTDSVGTDENRMINSFVDYDELMRHRSYIMRTYREPGNILKLLSTPENNGILEIDKERSYAIKYVLEDSYGNTCEYRFKIEGIRQEIPADERKADRMLHYDKVNLLQVPGFEMMIPKGRLYANVGVNIHIDTAAKGLSNTYTVDGGHVPMHDYCSLSIALKKMPVKNEQRYYVKRVTNKRTYAMKGECLNGWIHTQVRDLGSYSVELDTVPPVLTPLEKNKWRSNPRNIRFRVRDMESGIGDYKVYIDGKYALFWYKRGMLVFQDPDSIARGKKHTIKVVLSDICGNETIGEYSI